MCRLPSCACSEKKSQPWKWNALIHGNRVPIHRTSTFMLRNSPHSHETAYFPFVRVVFLINKVVSRFRNFRLSCAMSKQTNLNAWIETPSCNFTYPCSTIVGSAPPRQHDSLCLISFGKSFLDETVALRKQCNHIPIGRDRCLRYILWKPHKRVSTPYTCMPKWESSAEK